MRLIDADDAAQALRDVAAAQAWPESELSKKHSGERRLFAAVRGNAFFEAAMILEHWPAPALVNASGSDLMQVLNQMVEAGIIHVEKGGAT